MLGITSKVSASNPVMPLNIRVIKKYNYSIIGYKH